MINISQININNNLGTYRKYSLTVSSNIIQNDIDLNSSGIKFINLKLYDIYQKFYVYKNKR